MTLFILTETSAGYALLKSKDKKLLKRTDVHEEAATAEGAAGLYDSPNSVYMTLSLIPRL
jgi:nucleolar protein 58